MYINTYIQVLLLTIHFELGQCHDVKVATSTNLYVFGLTQPWFEPTNPHTGNRMLNRLDLTINYINSCENIKMEK